MNKQNAIRHILKKCKKVKTYEQYCEIYKLFCDNNCVWNIWLDRCDNCGWDDFGHCMLNDIDDTAPELNCCLPALIEELEKELQRNDNNDE